MGAPRTNYTSTELPKMRQDALTEALRLMDCSHPRGVICDHADVALHLIELGALSMGVNVVALYGQYLPKQVQHSILHPDFRREHNPPATGEPVERRNR